MDAVLIYCPLLFTRGETYSKGWEKKGQGSPLWAQGQKFKTVKVVASLVEKHCGHRPDLLWFSVENTPVSAGDIMPILSQRASLCHSHKPEQKLRWLCMMGCSFQFMIAYNSQVRTSFLMDVNGWPIFCWFSVGLNSTALCPYSRGDMNTFSCLFLFAQQIPRLSHSEEGRRKECESLTNPDAVNSSESAT